MPEAQERLSFCRDWWVFAVNHPRYLRHEASQEAIPPRHFTSSLFEKVAGLDPEGWRRLSAAVTSYVRHVAFEAGLSAEDSDDMTQEVCAQVASHVRGFRGARTGDNLHRWVRKIIWNKVVDFCRARARRPEGEAVGGAQPELAQIAEAERETGDLLPNTLQQRRILHCAMEVVRALVRPSTWDAFSAVALDARDAGEVAAELDMTPHGVHEAVHRVRALLDQYVKRLAKRWNDLG